ncbi:3-oxoacyl-ACP reductase FabG [Pseudonocardiaceae bacterium YIM PH 21723]|nr:3-oxoacyl-ACP reductase FabG [Pseudonocardiaceae bacterium YIM PH 21723]
MNEIKGKVALVTGGSRGIGAAIATRLAENGADVVLTYQQNTARDEEIVQKIVQCGRKAVAIRADSADVDAVTGAVQQTVDTFGRLDILVNNAAGFAIGGPGELTAADFDQLMAVNVRAPFVAMNAAALHMADGGRIISIGSNVAERTVFPGFALYAASKSALVGLTKGFARDLGPRGITVNLVSPGATNTDMAPDEEAFIAAVKGLTVLDRFAEPWEIAATVAHLAGDGGHYITGTTIHVDGGFTI